jgi:hypothetical protein
VIIKKYHFFNFLIYLLLPFFFFLNPNRIVGVLIFNQKAIESVNQAKPGKVANLPFIERMYKYIYKRENTKNVIKKTKIDKNLSL